MKYNYEIEEAIELIKKENVKVVCIQLPDGLKKEATKIARELEQKTNSQVFIWLDSCFGACDIPVELKNLKIELLVQFGHNQWPFWKSKVLEV
ncbi:diphthamide synthesis protein [Candidatus Woesearchaeota archaeon]|nr:diphthamide synthesis protein [Candidatus Woesearchaeota archaeon]